MRNIKKLAALGAVGMLALASGAVAAPVVTTGNTGGLNDSNVIFNACENASGVQGCLNDAQTMLVNFASNETLAVQGGGQARIDSTDGTFNTLSVSLDDDTMGFASLILNVNTARRDTGDVFFTADLASGGEFTSSLFSLMQGENFFTLLAGGNELFTSVTVQSVTGDRSVLFDDVRQVRIGGVAEIGDGGELPDTDVPEPAMLGLLGLGLLGIAASRRRKAA